jgi:aminopeptidase-like protein
MTMHDTASNMHREDLGVVQADVCGQALYALVAKLFPLCRSITGPGVRETLAILSELIPIRRIEVPTGMEAFDWTVPKEWSIREAYIGDEGGRRLVDFKNSNLHVLNYSMPFRGRMMMEELRPHLHSLPNQPDLIPYRTSYYKENWGFCLSQRQLDDLGEGPFDVVVDSTLAPGHLTIGEVVLPGEIKEEILISTHICHPSLANDNCAGMAIATALAVRAERTPFRHTLRVLFVPGTIGSIVWLAMNEKETAQIAHGLVLTGLGDKGSLTYKRSRRSDTMIDRAAAHVLSHKGDGSQIIDFSPWGYDERQYCSPGFNLPVGRLSRTPHGEFPEYHTSADNLSFVTPHALADSLATVEQILRIVDRQATYRSTNPMGEPRLGKRGLYRQTAGQGDAVPDEIPLLWVLNQSDGSRSLLEIAERSGLAFEVVYEAATTLHSAGLLQKRDEPLA